MKKYTREDIKIIERGPEHERLVNAIDLSIEGFRKNLICAASLARDFSQGYILEVLPEKIKFIVLLGQSYDGRPLEEREVAYTEDYEERERLFDSADSVVNLLWREGWVPEWINVQIRKEDSTFTYVELVCCGRFSNDKHLINHAHEGRAPFHVVGPALPLGYRDGEKFSLYWRENA
ncbi:hypothetical protein [Aurantivibrio infirmus]